MVIFHSYVSLPEGINPPKLNVSNWCPIFFENIRCSKKNPAISRTSASMTKKSPRRCAMPWRAKFMEDPEKVDIWSRKIGKSRKNWDFEDWDSSDLAWFRQQECGIHQQFRSLPWTLVISCAETSNMATWPWPWEIHFEMEKSSTNEQCDHSQQKLLRSSYNPPNFEHCSKFNKFWLV